MHYASLYRFVTKTFYRFLKNMSQSYYFINITYSYQIVLRGTSLHTYSSALYIKRKRFSQVYTPLIYCVVNNYYMLTLRCCEVLDTTF